MKKTFTRLVAGYLVLAMFIVGVVPRVEAGLAPSEAVAFAAVDRAADLGGIQKILETKMVQERLSKLGFTQDEISRRFSQLSNQQIHQLALQLDDLKVGGDGLGVVIAVLVIAILVVIVLQLTGHKVIVK